MKKIKILIILLFALGIVISLSYVVIFKLKHKNLLFSIYSTKIKCNSAILKVYDDKTYKFENKEGVFSYDVEKIIENASKYEPTKNDPFILTDNEGNSIKIYDNNNELMEFLKEIDINLDVCSDIR